MQTIIPASVVKPLRPDDKVIEDLLVSDEAFGTTMLTIVIDRFAPRNKAEEGLDCLTWAPATLREELFDEFKVVTSPGNIDRLMIAIDIVTGDTFWSDVSAFIRGCNVLAGSEASFEEFDPATVAEVAWGATEATLLWPDDEEDPAYPSDEVRAYVVQQLRREGYSRPPTMLSEFVQPGDLVEATDDFTDPEMNTGMGESADAKASEMDDLVRQEMGKLINQLESLPLRSGKTKELAKSLRKGIQHAPVSSR